MSEPTGVRSALLGAGGRLSPFRSGSRSEDRASRDVEDGQAPNEAEDRADDLPDHPGPVLEVVRGNQGDADEVEASMNQVVEDELAPLVAAAKAGDDSAFDELVRATYAATYTLALRLTGNDDDARDVAQDAYLRAYRSIRRFRGEARFTTWMYRITANCASTQLTRRKKHSHDELDSESPLADEHSTRSPEAGVENTDLRERLEVALRCLPPKLRAVVVLRDVYDLPHEAIAAELNISETAAKVRLHRARKRLRAELYPMTSEERAADAV